MKTINHKKWAKKIMTVLVKHVLNYEDGNKYLTYGDLAKKVKYPKPYRGNVFSKNIGTTLGVMGHMFDNIEIQDFNGNIPLLQCLVVNSRDKLPSSGFQEFSKAYNQLPMHKKIDLVNTEYEKIFNFGKKWELVLKKLKLKNPVFTNKLYNPYGSEGSPEHKRLRDYIAQNPQLVNFNFDCKIHTEYPLKSGDKIDVLFENDKEIIIVEVKSIRSDINDLERGVYQCVKYYAVIAAENKYFNINKRVNCFLISENSIPKALKNFAKLLNIEVLIERINK